MREPSRKFSTGRTKIDRPIGPPTDQDVADVLKDIVQLVLWPDNSAPELAAKIGCDARTVERYFEGSRNWSGDAITAIFEEILARKKMRNVRVVARR